MIGRRPLGELIAELAESAAVLATGPVRPRSVSIGVPIDLRVVPRGGGFELIGDLPLFRTRTAFDPDPARIEVGWQAVPYRGDEA